MIKASGDITVLGGTFVQESFVTHKFQDAWHRLHKHIAANAMHDSETLVKQEVCLEQTRKVVLRLLSDHLSAYNPKSPDTLWLSGPAGAGKSAIARTVAQSTSEARTLLGSFFFFKSDPRRNTKRPLIPTLAIQVCRRFPLARRYIEQAIDDDPIIFTKPINVQAEYLVVRPLIHALAESPLLVNTPLAIIVDGLDECTTQEEQLEIIDALLLIIARLHADTSLRVRLILASRPERWITDRISEYEEAGRATSIALSDDRFDTRADIERYYTIHFDNIRQHHPLKAFFGADWPSRKQMKALMDVTAKHFSFAHAAQVFVADPNEDPRKQLEIVLGTVARNPTSVSPHTPLDQLYSTIFSRIPNPMRQKTLRVIGAILLPGPQALTPSPRFLEFVFELERGEIQRMFFHLESIFDLGNHRTSYIRVYHTTLSDFLFDESRSKEYGLFINADAVREDICAAVQGVFRRQKRPDRKALAFLLRYLKFAYKDFPPVPNVKEIAGSQSGWLSKFKFGHSAQQELPPWAVHFLWMHSLEGRITSGFIHKFNFPSPRDYATWMIKSNPVCRPSGWKPQKAMAVYDQSPLGRLCLVFAGWAVEQGYSEEALFYSAFIKHAIQHQPGLLERDKSDGWNLFSCDLDNLTEAFIYFHSRSDSYINGVYEQSLRDTLAPDWQTSRLDMLLPWHNTGHRSSDDPWRYAPTAPNTGEGPQRCLKCLDVLDLCQLKVISNLFFSKHNGTALFKQVVDFMNARPSRWHMSPVLTKEIKTAATMVNSEDFPKDFQERLQTTLDTVDATLESKCRDIVRADRHGELAFYLVYMPYSRARIPFWLIDEHAVCVSRRREAWDDGIELPHVVYTYPGLPPPQAGEDG